MCVCACARMCMHTKVSGHMCMHALECVLTFYGSIVYPAAVTCQVENDCWKDDQKVIAKC